ncbi:hypothetical protein GQ43DRAFT_70023 [Delitschia confertaspora ATCC 74209]|uniref:Up-regulated during septation protein 1 domain-containing protein n=1 Tax=Delitschia confertaspora ATCC 74209 TaxID=1513339 RepID=A0A9P4JJX5_9PLEO|nr:hypothetical protein GQ43DRAFT_70023 [Delitschia confertaspora ATCC 74209]
MAHIAHCMRHDADKSNIHISAEMTLRSPASKEQIRPLEKSPSLVSLHQQLPPPKYNFWPSSASRSPVGLARLNLSADRTTALSMGRSPTSLSDTAASPESSLPFWQRSSSLSRRRKVSVPELGQTMATVQEAAIDSPTIPGRPPLRKTSSDQFGHERSSSAPGTGWRTGPFGDALIACVTGPSYLQPEQAGSPLATSETPKPETATSLGTGKPLSPILSPSNPKPALKLDTSTSFLETIDLDLDLPPEVPPKSPSQRKGSPAPKLNLKASKPQLITPASATSATPVSAVETRRSPNVTLAALPMLFPATFTSTSLPSSAVERRGSPKTQRRDPLSAHGRNMSDTSIMDRGRPTRRSSKRQRSRTCSDANTPESDSWKLPTGMRATDASKFLNVVDKKQLHKQALDQAEKFEVLNKRDVASMSRELRALDERCEYLRKTYKSLRTNRQKLHNRMISYLKRTETFIFSRESLLKQEEALAELDNSIDEFILKLEQSENRRLRVRQKLLEHVAGALVLNPSTAQQCGAQRFEAAESTPPRSPIKMESPLQINRKDVESIKIYADGHVLNLFSDIEQAIGKMCEQAC